MKRASAIVLTLVALASCGGSEAASPPTTAQPTAASEPPPSASAPSATALAACRPATADEAAAVAAAERFVAEQGYTDAPVPDDVEIRPEGIEPGSTRAERIQFRHGTLEPHALGVFPHEPGAAITVVFRYRAAEQAQRGVGRAVVLEHDAEPTHIVHQDALLDHAAALCPNGG